MSHTTKGTFRYTVAVFAGLAALLCEAPVAQAHDSLVSSDPAANSSVASGPSRVTLVFDEPVDSGFDQITVTGPDGTSRWDTGSTVVQGGTLSVDMRPSGPSGVYTVAYHIVSDDGHPVSGSYAFTLAAPGHAPSGTGTEGRPAATTAPSTAPLWAGIGGSAVLLFAAGAIVARRISR